MAMAHCPKATLPILKEEPKGEAAAAKWQGPEIPLFKPRQTRKEPKDEEQVQAKPRVERRPEVAAKSQLPAFKPYDRKRDKATLQDLAAAMAKTETKQAAGPSTSPKRRADSSYLAAPNPKKARLPARPTAPPPRLTKRDTSIIDLTGDMDVDDDPPPASTHRPIFQRPTIDATESIVKLVGAMDLGSGAADEPPIDQPSKDKPCVDKDESAFDQDEIIDLTSGDIDDVDDVAMEEGMNEARELSMAQDTDMEGLGQEPIDEEPDRKPLRGYGPVQAYVNPLRKPGFHDEIPAAALHVFRNEQAVMEVLRAADYEASPVVQECKPRPYQLPSIAWMIEAERGAKTERVAGHRGLLADAPGVGKTYTTCVAINICDKQYSDPSYDGPLRITLVVVGKTALVEQWERLTRQYGFSAGAIAAIGDIKVRGRGGQMASEVDS